MSENGRALICMFCGEGFGYAGQTPDEATLRTAVDHEKDCPKNPYTSEIGRLLPVLEAARCIRHWHDTCVNSESGETEGMVVSAQHVRQLWDAIAKYDAAESV